MEPRAALADRLTRATGGVGGPVAVVDLDRFDANAALLLRRAGGTPVRVASKSVRVRALVHRALDAGFRGVMAISPAEALWLAADGVTDVLVGYPSVDRASLAALARDVRARAAVTLMVDDDAHVTLVEQALREAGVDGPPVQVCLDVDASLRLGAGPLTLHAGTRRSPLRTPDEVARLAARVAGARGVRLRGVMTYEAQVAGLPDSGPLVRAVKRRTLGELPARRAAILAALREVVRDDVELVNAGGTGSLEGSASDPAVTEVTAGSGLYQPATFDGYRGVRFQPAAFFGLDVVRVPARGFATAFAGGYVASGAPGPSRLPVPVTPGWVLTPREGAGEVQTPLRRRRTTRSLAVGDRVWFRHAKAGELMERFEEVHLVRGDEVVDVVPTYRGEWKAFA